MIPTGWGMGKTAMRAQASATAKLHVLPQGCKPYTWTHPDRIKGSYLKPMLGRYLGPYIVVPVLLTWLSKRGLPWQTADPTMAFCQDFIKIAKWVISFTFVTLELSHRIYTHCSVLCLYGLYIYCHTVHKSIYTCQITVKCLFYHILSNSVNKTIFPAFNVITSFLAAVNRGMQ